jgi:DNA invertase Pin-like site-specific DNA recombinase
MRQAIAYIRVSTDRQGESGFGYDAQRAHITAYAKERGFRIKKFYSDVDTGKGGDSFDVRPDRALAEERARRTKFPIIVASLDRFARDTDTIENRVIQGNLAVISARLGEHATSAEIRAQAYRDQREGELISKRTKDALKFLKDSGVTLGNKQMRDVVQRKAVETNKKNAALRSGDFERELAEVRSIGATTAKQIAAAFNERGFLTARGERWTPGNVARALGKLRARQRSDAVKATMTSIVGYDGDLTSEGEERCRKAMAAKGVKPEDIDGFIAKWDSEAIDEKRTRKIAEWVVDAEAVAMR